MFLFTMTKPGLRQAGALALCGVCLAGAITAAVHFTGGTVTAGADAEPGIETTQDIAAFFTGHGFEVDLATAAVDKVKIPKTWDDSFTAFDQVVGESGMTLADYKGKTVEKWTVLCPALSDGEQDTYCVLLVYKGKAVGAYLLEKPSGEVSGLISAAQTLAEAQAAAEEAPAGTSPPAEEPAAAGEDDAQAVSGTTDAGSAQASADAAAEETEVSADLTDAGVWPVD